MAARSWDMQPSEFWALTMREIILEGQMRRPRDKATDYAGSLTQGDIDELDAMLREG